ncbi:Bug family tripartite tricarboxylate transporter substrate binding protein [Piscinibacter koreensis]|uniref:Tripartite tricarboxylate transporter substrate binding protein n=1 Tax=Piscinibacter koreensis TaxID=2742824 RepID=A0A7Y6NRW0_9BURK|nr:tripartite tricarboxylate transporter substrate binding protein [Schlegelella koreensis]NUZ08154.1 tripartite tricarboxylate transporter substrate binding protein [Schlegelella koreensis]
MKRRATLALAALLAVAALPAAAQSTWPSRPVRIVVPYAPGSSPDVLIRIMGEKLGPRLGQPLVIENRPGAGGNTGTDHVAKSAPDGYTFLVSTNGPLVYSTVFNPKLPYDPFKDLAPVTLAGGQPNVCAVSNDMNVADVKAWVAAMRQNPGKYNYSSTGIGSMSHLSIEILKLRTNSFAVHLPYASSPQAITAILQGDVQFACVPPVAVMPQAKAGKLKAVAVTSAKRSALVPGVPTLAESGFPEIQALAWMAVMAPARTPADVIERMNREMVAVLNDPEVRNKLATAYIEPIGSTPAELAKWMTEERTRWAPVIKYAELKAE